MLLDKIWLIRLMTACTEGQHIVFQKIFRLGGTVRIMAVDAPFVDRIMLELRFGHGIADILVAIETEFIPSFQKGKFVF